MHNWWELACRAEKDGFMAELPPGKYYYGYAPHITSLGDGVWTSMIDDTIVCIAPLGKSVCVNNDGPDIKCPNGLFTFMNVVSDDYLVDVFDIEERFVVKYSDSVLTLNWSNNIMVIAERDVPEESDEQIYVRLYAAQGIKY